MTTTSVSAKILPLFQKKKHLESLSENDFRDTVVRPLYLLQGLTGGRDTCGTDEEGKDCYMFREDRIAGRQLYVIQTKKGDITMAGTSKKNANLINVVTQLRMALVTPVKDIKTHAPYYPGLVILAASGTINKAARDHIVAEVKEPRLLFRDADELIFDIDEYMPEFWNGISVAKIPYLRNFRDQLLNDSRTIDATEFGIGGPVIPPITEETFAPLYLHRYEPKVVKTAPKIDRKSKSPYAGTHTEERIDVIEIPVQDLLKSYESLSFITGDAGAGKTTALRRLAMILTDNALMSKDESRIPVYMTAKSISEASVSLVEHATSATKSLTIDGASAFTINDLNAGHVVLLVDALDEVSNSIDRERILQKIMEARKSYGKLQVIVTSRIFPSIGELAKRNGFTLFNISPISFVHAEAMINRLTKDQSLSKEATNEMLRRLENVHGLELNPLLVTVFVSTSDYSRTDIPANITELFKKYTEMMLGRWNRSKTLGQQYESHVKDMLLCRIAYDMHSARTTSITVSRLRELIQKEIDDRDLALKLDTVYTEIIEHSGLVRIQGAEISFRHHLLQEFFAGRGIPSSDLLAGYAPDVWWTKALVFYFGQNPDDHHALTALRNGLDSYIGVDRYQAAIVVGLACQACYLMKKTQRIEALTWVITELAKAKETALADFRKNENIGELMSFIWYYIYGRDAVAAKGISEVLTDVSSRLNLVTSNDPANVTAREQLLCEFFWCVAGLIESHNLELASEVVRKFTASDPRMYLALFLGAYCVEKLHFTTAPERKSAKRIADTLDPLIVHLRPTFYQEMKGYLLELRGGQVSVLDRKSDPE